VKPFDPFQLDIVSFMPVQHHVNFWVDFDEALIQQTADSADGSACINEVYLLTDSEQVAKHASEWDVSVPFTRPAEFSRKDVPVVEVFKHALER
jgi:CMP-N-acetylneuraminic acid synthetase